MIKAFIKDFNELIEFNESIYSINFEDAIIFRNFILNLKENFLFTYDQREINFEKEILIINNLLDLSLNEKKLITLLYKNIQNSITDYQNNILCNINKDLIKLFDDIIFESDYRIEYNSEYNISSLFSLLQLSFKEIDKNNFLEYFLNYINIYKSLCNIKIVICIDFLSYFNEVEYEKLMKELKLIDVVLINLVNKSSIKSNIIIDNEYCII